MKKLAWLPCVVLLVGCRESADALSRDYRNLNNEAVDTLMMVTGESSARLATERILKQYGERKKAIDDRFKTWKQNTDDDEITTTTLQSESVMFLLIETKINKQRAVLEKERIEKLFQTSGGSKEITPNLHELATTGKISGVAKDVGDQGAFGALLAEFETPGWAKKVKPASLAFRKSFDEKLRKLEQPEITLR
jgi:hypothetical protein